MRDSESFDDVDLVELAKWLRLEGMPVQSVIASEAGVSQPTVSRAARGMIKRPTRGARRLWAYAAKRVSLLEGWAFEQNEFLPKQSEPDREEEVTTEAAVARKRASPLPRYRRGSVARIIEDEVHLAEAAMNGLREYLDDKFDPVLVIEQLAVLRRAQDSARTRSSDV